MRWLCLLLLASAQTLIGGAFRLADLGRAAKHYSDEFLSAKAEDDRDPYDVFNPVAPLKKNTAGEVWVPQLARPRRNRKSAAIRSAVKEAVLRPSNLVYPLFIHEDSEDVAIGSMPGCKRLSLASMLEEVKAAMAVGVKAFILFPKIPDHLKTVDGAEAYNPAGLVPRAVSMLKAAFPEAVVMTDVALDPYSSVGHDGVVRDGKIVNDETIAQLAKQAVCQARAGADVVAPSDMMDGRVAAIRTALDAEGFTDVSILSYTAKYASSFYGPFRDALDSHPGFGDKKTYQQDPAGSGREAEREAMLDVSEGADILLVKPGLPYLDILARLRRTTKLPLAVYQVSGEYAMIKAAAANGWLDERKVVLETLSSFRRAGADLILTYFAKQAAQWIVEAGEPSI